MKVHPRQELLSIWRAVVRNSWRNGKWKWGGREKSNSISDAEQLLCILLPATQLDEFRLERPNETDNEMADILKPLGGVLDIPPILVKLLNEYFTTYRDSSGAPTFSGGSYFVAESGEKPVPEQLSLPIVDSYAISMVLSLAALGFARVYRSSAQRSETLDDLDRLEQLASTRLSAAMVGLLRSFSVNVFAYESEDGENLVKTLNQEGIAPSRLVERLRRELRETLASFNNTVLIGSGRRSLEELTLPDRLFECGWSWGVVEGAPDIEVDDQKLEAKIGEQPKGYALDKPYLYFTVTALDAIEDLLSERTRTLSLLNEEQQRLAQALQLRYDLTRTYWATVATFGAGRWPLEDMPWKTVDGVESIYFTLLVTSLAVKGFTRERGSDAELVRVGAVLEDLAERALITSRAVAGDPMLNLHDPGVMLLLEGAEVGGGPTLRWPITEFAALLMQRTHVIAQLLTDGERRSDLIGLADRVWSHISARRLRDETTGRGLWDQPSLVFPSIKTLYEDTSWYYTERVVLALIAAARTVQRPTLRSNMLHGYALELVIEAEHLLDKELLAGAVEGRGPMGRSVQRIRADLSRARRYAGERPATSTALAIEALQKLDELAAARMNVAEG
ncbi:hypothetical protein Dvina_06055 [Dactylosporangium vinaceum]|uniref:SCO2524 family protein n=1 Tax=Dactylosporangium vinaceum TaxID=53362 RepID=A0ABV5MST1_9ACTN|nr:SCO2524 family protein [Dactylosporangium vinaceum]UAB97686.1 hypothetical protein Dvina_06055 [Dactylosporangium vinaceum]